MLHILMSCQAQSLQESFSFQKLQKLFLDVSTHRNFTPLSNLDIQIATVKYLKKEHFIGRFQMCKLVRFVFGFLFSLVTVTSTSLDVQCHCKYTCFSKCSSFLKTRQGFSLLLLEDFLFFYFVFQMLLLVEMLLHMQGGKYCNHLQLQEQANNHDKRKIQVSHATVHGKVTCVSSSFYMQDKQQQLPDGSAPVLVLFPFFLLFFPSCHYYFLDEPQS